MFEYYLIKGINEYTKNPSPDNKDYLKNLIRNNEDKIEKFLQNPEIESDKKKVIEDLINEVKTELNKTNNNFSKVEDIDIQIKNYILESYNKWKLDYLKNGKVTEVSKNIINQIVDSLYPTYLAKLLKVLEIENESTFEDFKTMIKNRLRYVIGDEIEKYLDSEKYKNLNFFEKRKIKKRIFKVIKDISKYEFNLEDIKELNKWLI